MADVKRTTEATTTLDALTREEERNAWIECVRRLYDSGGDAPNFGEHGPWVEAFDAATADWEAERDGFEPSPPPMALKSGGRKEAMTDTTVDATYDAINECRRLVMDLYGGNLDHPALDHLEAAMSAITEIERAEGSHD